MVELPNGFAAVDAQIAAAQQLPHAVTDVGKPQIGDGINLLLRQCYFKIVFHRVPPRLMRSWAQKPVNRPVKMLIITSTGR